MTDPVSVAAARERAGRVYDRHAASWAAWGVDGPAFELPLHPPTEATALADEPGAVAWAASWRRVPGVVWVPRRWANLGTQQVPGRLRLTTPGEVAVFAGRAAHWRLLSSRSAELVGRWGDVVRDAVRRHARALTELPETDLARLLAVVEWLVAHPDSGMYLRQLPIAGIDTKWIASHRILVTALVEALSGSRDLGLREPPGLVRVRFLDAALAPGGVRDLAAPVGELDRLDIRPSRVFVFENLESVVAMPEVPGAVVVHGSGYAASRLGDVRWARESPITYWGDLDNDGFAILDRIRASCPQVASVLMDERTLLAHRDLWGADPTPVPGQLPRLTGDEREVLERLREFGGVRLEQERLAWPACLAALLA